MMGWHWRNRAPAFRRDSLQLGHRNIQHTVRYAELSPTRFNDLRRSLARSILRSLTLRGLFGVISSAPVAGPKKELVTCVDIGINEAAFVLE